MSKNLFLGRISCLCPSLPLNGTTPFASSNATTQASPPNAQFAVQYLVESCGLSSDEALKASKHIHRLKSPDKPDKVLRFLRSIGFSQEEVTLLISKAPFLLKTSEKSVARKMEFLMKEAGCDKLHVIGNHFFLGCSLENRLIPRNIVRKLLVSKGLPVANLKFATFAKPSDEKFVEKFVLPYEHVIPGLHRAYADAGRIGGIDTGVSQSDIKTAVSRNAGIFCSHVEKNWRPNITKLQEVGFSMEDISSIISVNPDLFGFNFVPKIDFWMGVLESVENLSVVLKARGVALITSSLEKVIIPNLSFLLENCGLSTRQIVRVIKQSPQLISSRPEYVKRVVETVDELGIDRSSASFCDALIAVRSMSKSSIDAKLNNLRNIGFSQEEVKLLISKYPLLLKKSEKSVARKMEFLMKEASCDKLHVIRNPFFLLGCSLENRLIPRNIVRKLLVSKGLPVANLKFATFAMPSDEKFVEKFVLPYEHVIPGLHRAYADAGRIGGIAHVEEHLKLTFLQA